MTRMRQCGLYPPAAGRDPYCPVCDRISDLSADAPEATIVAALDAIGAREDRITEMHASYRRRRRCQPR